MRTLIASIAVAVALLVPSANSASRSAEFNTTLLDSRTLDIGQKGPSIGDASVRKWRLTDRLGNPIGSGYEVCRWTSSALRVCNGVYDLPTGQIVFQGVLKSGVPMAVVGGTGDFMRASGELVRRGRTVLVTL